MEFVRGNGMNALAERLEGRKGGRRLRLAGRSGGGRNEDGGRSDCGRMEKSTTGEKRILRSHGERECGASGLGVKGVRDKRMDAEMTATGRERGPSGMQ